MGGARSQKGWARPCERYDGDAKSGGGISTAEKKSGIYEARSPHWHGIFRLISEGSGETMEKTLEAIGRGGLCTWGKVALKRGCVERAEKEKGGIRVRPLRGCAGAKGRFSKKGTSVAAAGSRSRSHCKRTRLGSLKIRDAQKKRRGKRGKRKKADLLPQRRLTSPSAVLEKRRQEEAIYSEDGGPFKKKQNAGKGEEGNARAFRDVHLLVKPSRNRLSQTTQKGGSRTKMPFTGSDFQRTITASHGGLLTERRTPTGRAW